jgi:hypothetical protein
MASEVLLDFLTQLSISLNIDLAFNMTFRLDNDLPTHSTGWLKKGTYDPALTLA